MNCTDWEERIALYSGGDLDSRTAAEVERHLAECSGCQVFASGLSESLACARAAHADGIAPGHYTALRARVMAAVEREKRGWRWMWRYAAAAVAAALLVGLGLRMRVSQMPPVALHNAPPAAAWQMTRTERPAQIQRASARPARRSHAPEPVLVKVETDNPDVVILWITETKGEN